MRRLPLHGLDRSGADDGQVPRWSDDDQAWVPGAAIDAPTTVLVPLTTVIDGEPALVWDADNELVMTEEPLYG